VMELVVEGKASKVIARLLGISAKTVEFHRARVMDKMQAHSALDLVRTVLAAQQGAPSTATPTAAGSKTR
jgi:two-component system response regulator FixJ